ncbi:class I SAM-dependent methyltransferase [Algivirga pacifica]|uniref:Class I SAM-dependent methyltransferase n=1 Tax=Algivirga pacifica TaxID=1162670 RepID=A0ABP9CWE6_9BACT
MKDFWNQRYQEEPLAYGKTPNEFFKSVIDETQPGKLLLPAEGEGRNAIYAAKKGWEVTAVDFSEEARKKALAWAAQEEVHITYHTASLETFEVEENDYDMVALIYAHMPAHIRQTIHRKFFKALRKGGVLVLEGFNHRQLKNNSGGPKSQDMLFELRMLIDDLQGANIHMIEEQTLVLDEGPYHQGQADVIRLFAEKV